MVACAFARGCARVLVCAFVMGAASAAAQETAEPDAAAASETSEASGAADAADGDNKTKNSAALPGLVVETSPKPAEKKVAKKNKGTTTAAASAAAGEDTQPEVPGIVYGQALSDTGTTTFDAANIKMRTDGSGDANTFLRNLPNVQYQDQTDDEPGATAGKSIDSKPLLLSISGGRTYENNFILNGVSVSNITGPVDWSDNLPADDASTPSANNIYGLHPQTIYVPTEFIGQATVIDSNASAEYGQFQGGVVVYDLAAPPTDRYHASVSASRHTSEMVNYILATEDGLNPDKRQAPTFEKNNLAVSVGAPITSDFAFIAQASRKQAETSKQKVYYISDDWVHENSDNIFLRFAATARTDLGKLTLDVSRTDYFQHWENPHGRDLYIDTQTDSTTSQLKLERDLAGVRVDSVGLGRAKLEARAFYNTSETLNTSGGNTTYNWLNQRRRTYNAATGTWSTWYDTTLHDDWCRGMDLTQADQSSVQFSCREGGYGNKLQGQTDYGAQAKVDGDLLLGSFKLGAELKQYEGRRARLEDYYFVGSMAVASYPSSYQTTGGTSPVVSAINCDPSDTMCDAEQYAGRYTLYEKYDVTAKVAAAHTFAEIDQTWRWFNVRAGLRVDYDDYFENINLAPRLAGTVTPFEGLSFTGGYNRYYLGETLYYAIRDKQSRGYTVVRKHDANGVPYIYQSYANELIRYQAAGLNTPYDDEYTGAVRIKDPLLGGQLRLKYLERYSRDQFESDDCELAGVSQCYRLTNNAWRNYRSASAEYTKEWHRLKTPFYLDAAAITGQVTWSEQTASRGTYLDDEDDPTIKPIWYNDASYSRAGFQAVTGNLDIPVRIGSTLSTVWFNNTLVLNLSAGVNLGYEGVYDTTKQHVDEYGIDHDVYDDRKFGATLLLDASGQINVTEQAAIEFHVNNITNSKGNAVASDDFPWVIGRSYYIGSALRF